MGGLFSSPNLPDPKPAPIPSPDTEGVRAAGDAARERQRRRRGGLATIVAGFDQTSGQAGGYASKTGSV